MFLSPNPSVRVRRLLVLLCWLVLMHAAPSASAIEGLNQPLVAYQNPHRGNRGRGVDSLPPGTTRPEPAVVYVMPGGTGARTGLGWDNAKDLQPALTTAISGTVIWAKAGTYAPSTGSDDSTASFALKSGVSLYGGFGGTETQLSQRNIQANPTILSGLPSKSYHVVTASGTDQTALLDGFIISGGRADEVLEDYSLTINSYGGGMLNVGGNPTIRNVVFRDNVAFRGAGVYNKDSQAVFDNVAILENSTATYDFIRGYGAGMYNYNSRIRITNSDISLNDAADGFGGAMFNDDSAVSHVFMSNTTITKNVAKINGGVGGSSTHVKIVDCLFQQNYAESGGALQAGGGFIYSSMFLSNTVAYNAAGVNVSNVTIHNSVFRGNKAFLNAAISAERPITITNTTIVSNTSLDTNNEGAIIDFGTRASQRNSRFANTIVWGNAGRTFIFPLSGNITLTHNILPEALPGIGNSVEDPRLDGASRLRAASPARDTGDSQVVPPDVFDQDHDGDTSEPVSIDLAGQPRIQGERIDRGAYEFMPEPVSRLDRVFLPLLASDPSP